ncbi:MAG TPA: hypothetical protein VF459_00345 [Caulobacteraceae bacterium]
MPLSQSKKRRSEAVAEPVGSGAVGAVRSNPSTADSCGDLGPVRLVSLRGELTASDRAPAPCPLAPAKGAEADQAMTTAEAVAAALARLDGAIPLVDTSKALKPRL